MRVYLCYNQLDTERARELQDEMQEAGAKVFFDKDSIPGGEDWQRSIEKEIVSSDFVVLLWSRNAARSTWVMREYTIASINKKRIIPCAIDEEPISPLFENLQVLQLGGDATRLKSRLLEALGISPAKTDHGSAPSTVAEAIDIYKQAVRLQFGCLSVLGRNDVCPIDTIYLPLNIRRDSPDAALREPMPVTALLSVPVQDAIILGHPGSGKSTALRYLAYRAVGVKNIFPGFFRIAELMSTNDSIEDFIAQQMKGQLGKQVSELIATDAHFCRAGSLILMDGLDEISEEDKKLFMKLLAGFRKGYPDCRIVITSRFPGFSAANFPDFPVFYLEALTPASIETYIKAECKPDISDNAWRLIRDDSRLLELAKTPFLLALMCAAPHALGSRAAQRAGLFRECIKYLLKEQDWEPAGPGRQKETESIAHLLESALKTIAVRLFKLDVKDEFSEDEILFCVRDLLTADDLRPRELVEKLISATGLLHRSGKKLCFVHRTIWEYFVALGMQDEPLENLLERASMPAWEEPIRLCTGLSNPDKLKLLLRGLWGKNKGLALRSMTELAEIPKDLLTELVGGLDRAERVRLMFDLEETLREIANPLDSRRTLLDTVRVIVCFEKDCEVLYHCIDLLENMARDQNCADCQALVDVILESGTIAARRDHYLSEPNRKFDLVAIPAGEFQMGSNDNDRTPDEKPAHTVRLDSYMIMRYPVTNGLYYDAFPYAIDRREIRSNQDDQPVIFPTWYEAYIFARWLGCDLPTEAEWEYACRSGGKDDAVLYDANKLPEYAWFAGNSNNETHVVGTKLANSFGLYDMLGNVREWCKDWFAPGYYEACASIGIVLSPPGAPRGSRKSLKGGCFDWNIANLVPTYRNSNPPESSYFANGFRLVCRERVF